MIEGDFCKSPRAFVDEQAVEFPAIPIILEIIARAIPLSAQFPLGGGWSAAGCSLLPHARARARGARNMLAGWAAAGGARLHAARGRTTEWRREVARLKGGARSHASSPAQPAVARRARH